MNNNNRRPQPFFAEPAPHGVGSYGEDELEESSPEAEEEDEYDVNNDETFGNTEAVTGHEAEPDLEEFANRTACFPFDDMPTVRGKLPNLDDIPMPVFDRSTPAVERDKVLEQSVSADVMANIWGRQTINGAQPMEPMGIIPVPSECDGGVSALDEIERRLGRLGREISTSQWPPSPDLKLRSKENYQHLASSGIARSAFNAEELERKMLMEAAATAIRRQQSPLLPLPAGVIRPTPINPTTSLQSPPFNLTQSLSPHAPPPGFPRPIVPPHFLSSLMSPTPTAHQHPHSIPPPMQFTTPPPPHTALPPHHGMQWVRSPHPMHQHALQNSHRPPSNRSVNVNIGAHGILPPPPQWPGNLIAGRGARGMGLPPPFPPPNMLAYNYNSQFPPLPSQQRTAGAVPEVSLISMRPLSPALANMPGCMAQRRAVAPQQRSSDTYVFRRKPNNLPSSRTISDYAFDPYAGFLSKKEREWLIKIHLIQCAGTGDSLEDDFYYTAWKQRNVLKRRSDGTRKEKGRYYSFEVHHHDFVCVVAIYDWAGLFLQDTYPSDRYIPPSFSGSLGRLTHCSATLPRQVIDVASHDDAQEEDDGSGAKSGSSQQKKLKIMLIRIENAALVLIECRDALRKLASIPDEGEEEETRAELTKLLQRHSDALFNYASNERLLPTIMAIQKGRALLFETMTAGIFNEGQLVQVISQLYACMPRYSKRIPDESIPATVKGLSRVLSSISDWKLLIDLANSCAVDAGLLESLKFLQLSLLALLIALANCHCSARQLNDSAPLLQWLKSGASAKFNPNSMKLEDLPLRTEHLLSLLHWLLVAIGDQRSGGGTEGIETNAQRLLASLEKLLASGTEL